MDEGDTAPTPLDLSELPAIFLSRTHFTDHDLHELEDALISCGAPLTYNVLEARIIISKVTKKQRVLFDLRAAGLALVEITQPSNDVSASAMTDSVATSTEPILIEDSSTASEGETKQESPVKTKSAPSTDTANAVRVVGVQWFQDSKTSGIVQPLEDYTSFIGTQAQAPRNVVSTSTMPAPKQSERGISQIMPAASNESILQRAKEDAGHTGSHFVRSFKRKHGQQMIAGPNDASWTAGYSKVQHAHLLHATTSEEEHGCSNDLPEPPEWVRTAIKYACQRRTPAGSPNEDFIALLRKIKIARLLISDEIGVRAYSTSIAALLAYPHKFVSPREIMRLPGCDAKIANLFVEWKNTGRIKAVEDSEADHDLKILRLFYDIWGVGSTTAREFYYDKGWSDLDDLVDYNWKGLSRVQQVGVKFYEQFLERIPRAEVERIGEVVHKHAVKVRDEDVQTIIVGGYRRGKAQSGDVDIIVSHPDESKTLNIITDIVASLEEEGWITHTLLIALTSTHREQQTLPFRSGKMHGGHGFDNLDKSFVVWQDPNWPTKDAELAADPKAKNSNIHRRVDIIIAPWRTVGCAVLGWSGGTTFQRDVRRYVKHKFGWKFDSSGVRDRANGEVLDLEGFHRYEGKIGSGRAKTMLEAEQRVFEGLQLAFVNPHDRCTD